MDKPSLLQFVKAQFAARLATAREAMDAAQSAANEESKSTMGDKYETGRAMAQIDRDMYARQYEQNLQEIAVLERMEQAPANLNSEVVTVGSLLDTTLGWVFLSVSLGAINFQGQGVMVVSTKSPIGRAVLGRKKGDYFVFSGKSHRILELH